MITIALSTLYLSYNVKQESTNYNRVYDSFYDGLNYIYIIKEGNNYTTKQFDTKLELKNNIISYEETSEIKIVLLFIFGLFTVFLLIGFIMGLGDDELSWEFSDCWKNTLLSLVYCEFEDNKYYYLVLGRLLYTSNELLYKENIQYKISFTKFTDIMIYPKFETKRKKRNVLLDRLGI